MTPELRKAIGEKAKERELYGDNFVNYVNGAEACFEIMQAEIERLRAAMGFALRGLEMWRKFQSPGNIAEVESAIDAALKDPGGV